MDTSYIPEIAEAIAEKYKPMGFPVCVDVFNVYPTHKYSAKHSQFIISCYLDGKLNTLYVKCFERFDIDNTIWIFEGTEHLMQIRCDRPMKRNESIESYVRDNLMVNKFEPRFLW
jgi:hypothetical protein